MNVHPIKIEMIVVVTEVIDIMMIENSMIRGEMKTINHIIIDFIMTYGMITEDPRHPDNFSITPKAEMSQNYWMFSNHIMRTNPMGCY